MAVRLTDNDVRLLYETIQSLGGVPNYKKLSELANVPVGTVRMRWTRFQDKIGVKQDDHGSGKQLIAPSKAVDLSEVGASIGTAIGDRPGGKRTRRKRKTYVGSDHEMKEHSNSESSSRPAKRQTRGRKVDYTDHVGQHSDEDSSFKADDTDGEGGYQDGDQAVAANKVSVKTNPLPSADLQVATPRDEQAAVTTENFMVEDEAEDDFQSTSATSDVTGDDASTDTKAEAQLMNQMVRTQRYLQDAKTRDGTASTPQMSGKSKYKNKSREEILQSIEHDEPLTPPGTQSKSPVSQNIRPSASESESDSEQVHEQLKVPFENTISEFDTMQTSPLLLHPGKQILRPRVRNSSAVAKDYEACIPLSLNPPLPLPGAFQPVKEVTNAVEDQVDDDAVANDDVSSFSVGRNTAAGGTWGLSKLKFW